MTEGTLNRILLELLGRYWANTSSIPPIRGCIINPQDIEELCEGTGIEPNQAVHFTYSFMGRKIPFNFSDAVPKGELGVVFGPWESLKKSTKS